jgi:hypothetical protein
MIVFAARQFSPLSCLFFGYERGPILLNIKKNVSQLPCWQFSLGARAPEHSGRILTRRDTSKSPCPPGYGFWYASLIFRHPWSIEVTGMELVHGLHGWIHISQLLEKFLLLLFPLAVSYFLISINSKMMLHLEIERSCITYPVSHQPYVVQGIFQPWGNFCKRRSESHQ